MSTMPRNSPNKHLLTFENVYGTVYTHPWLESLYSEHLSKLNATHAKKGETKSFFFCGLQNGGSCSPLFFHLAWPIILYVFFCCNFWNNSQNCSAYIQRRLVCTFRWKYRWIFYEEEEKKTISEHGTHI